MQKPTLPSMNKQMHYSTNNVIVTEIFLKLTLTEQKHIKDLSIQAVVHAEKQSSLR